MMISIVLSMKFIYVKNANEAKYQYFSKKREKNIVGNLKNPNFFI